MARLLANYYLWQDDLPGILLPWENRDRYYDALEECNSKEPGAWGDLTDLIGIFCDVFEDTLEQIAVVNDEEVVEVVEPVVVDHVASDTSVSRLMSRLSGAATAVTAKEQ